MGQPSPYAVDGLVTIGRVGKPHGLKGEFRCQPETDFPERFFDTQHVHVYRESGGPVRQVEVENARDQGGKLILKLRGVDTPEAVRELSHCLLAAGEDEVVELEDGEFYHYELEGLEVRDEHDMPIGTVREVWDTPAHPIYVIDSRDGELLVPAVDEYVLDVNLEDGTVKIRVPQTLED